MGILPVVMQLRTVGLQPEYKVEVKTKNKPKSDLFYILSNQSSACGLYHSIE